MLFITLFIIKDIFPIPFLILRIIPWSFQKVIESIIHWSFDYTHNFFFFWFSECKQANFIGQDKYVVTKLQTKEANSNKKPNIHWKTRSTCIAYIAGNSVHIELGWQKKIHQLLKHELFNKYFYYVIIGHTA